MHVVLEMIDKNYKEYTCFITCNHSTMQPCNHATMQPCFTTVKTIKINRKIITLTREPDALNL